MKTAIIVLLLLAVLYGVYVVLNKPEAAAPPGALDGVDLASGPVIDFPETLPPPSDPSTGPETPAPGVADSLFPTSPTPAAEPIQPPPNFTQSPAPSAESPQAADASASPDTPVTHEPAGTPSESQTKPPEAPPAGLAAEDDYPSTPLPGVGNRTESAASSEPAATADSPPAGPWEPLAKSPSQPASTSPPSSAATSETKSEVPVGEPNGLQQVLQSVRAKIDEGQWYEALFTLSLQYGSPDMTPEERQQLFEILDPLAGKVIYSTEHLIEPPYEVRRGERLEDIAQRYNVPWQLLANINGIDNPDSLLPGTTIKIVPGPFRAEVDLTGKELTLFVNRLYAGRFPITVGSDPSPPPGEYRVNDKQAGRAYYSGDGRTIPAADAVNPYGEIWIDLGGDVCIHGSPRSDHDGRMGCISLSPIDARDVFGILSKGSNVTIRR